MTVRVFAGEYNLTISPVTLDDDGVYQCQVGVGKRDEPAIRSRKAALTVLVAPDRPRIVQGETVTAAENVPVELECVSEGGKPPAEVSADFRYGFFPTVANCARKPTFSLRAVDETTTHDENNDVCRPALNTRENQKRAGKEPIRPVVDLNVDLM